MYLHISLRVGKTPDGLNGNGKPQTCIISMEEFVVKECQWLSERQTPPLVVEASKRVGWKLVFKASWIAKTPDEPPPMMHTVEFGGSCGDVAIR